MLKISSVGLGKMHIGNRIYSQGAIGPTGTIGPTGAIGPTGTVGPTGQSSQPNASKWTFNRLMQDPNFKQTFETVKKQRANEKQILQYWESMGIQYRQIPEILEVIG